MSSRLRNQPHSVAILDQWTKSELVAWLPTEATQEPPASLLQKLGKLVDAVKPVFHVQRHPVLQVRPLVLEELPGVE